MARRRSTSRVKRGNPAQGVKLPQASAAMRETVKQARAHTPIPAQTFPRYTGIKARSTGGGGFEPGKINQTRSGRR